MPKSMCNICVGEGGRRDVPENYSTGRFATLVRYSLFQYFTGPRVQDSYLFIFARSD